MTIVAAIDSTLRRCALPGHRLVVGVSGGTDSVALLLGLLDLREELGLKLVVAHLDHALRADSPADAEFVTDLCRCHSVECVVGKWELGPSYRSSTSGVEAAARDARYAFFGEVVRQAGASIVLTGHTTDDQTETRLMHLVRGTGLRGLAGMAVDRVLRVPSGGSVRVVRPLLSCSRSATESFCASRGVVPCIDSSNADPTLTRNRVRHQITPILRQINPRFDDALARLARIAEDADELVESELDRRLPTVLTIVDDQWLIDRAEWRVLPRALKRALLRRRLSAEPVAEVGADAVEEVIQAIDTASAGTTLTWPVGLTFRLDYDRATLADEPVLAARLKTATVDLASLPADPVVIAHETNRPSGPTSAASGVGGLALSVTPREGPCPSRSKDRWHIDLDRAKLAQVTTLIVRSRRAGDRFAPVGMVGTKKIQDLLVDLHVPRTARDVIPIVVTSAGDVVWIAGVRPDQRFIASADTTDVLCLALAVPSENGERLIDLPEE